MFQNCENVRRNVVELPIRSGANVCKSCRSRRELSDEYLVAKIGFDTAENEPLKVCQKKGKRLETKLE